MGGTRRGIVNTPAALLYVCGQGNTSGCHGELESHRDEARDLGQLLYDYQDPAAVPVVAVHLGVTFLLDQQGGKHYLDPTEGQA